MQFCTYCNYVLQDDYERISHVLGSHAKKCIYCENSQDYSNKTQHLQEAHPERCIHCEEYSIEHPTYADKLQHMTSFHKEILELLQQIFVIQG